LSGFAPALTAEAVAVRAASSGERPGMVGCGVRAVSVRGTAIVAVAASLSKGVGVLSTFVAGAVEVPQATRNRLSRSKRIHRYRIVYPPIGYLGESIRNAWTLGMSERTEPWSAEPRILS
jgi:hypothetical protein